VRNALDVRCESKELSKTASVEMWCARTLCAGERRSAHSLTLLTVSKGGQPHDFKTPESQVKVPPIPEINIAKSTATEHTLKFDL
jgi:hypothetical protein